MCRCQNLFFVSLIGIHADVDIAAVRTHQLYLRTLYVHKPAVVFVLFPGVHTSGCSFTRSLYCL